MANLLSREAILAAARTCLDVTVPEWGEGAVARIRQMSVTERADYLETIRKYNEAEDAYEEDQALPVKKRKNVPKPADLDYAVLSIVRSVVDEEGNRMFSDADMPAFVEMGHVVVHRLWEAVQELNAFRKAPIELVTAEKKG